jgi:hypothetical protein
METTLRNASLENLAQVLQEQAAARFDVVAHSANLSFRGGNLIVQGADAILTEEGVTSVETHLRPTDIFDSGISQRLDIPRKYLARMREAGEADLLDHNVNTWLARSNRQWFVRGFKSDADTEGVARAFLSDRFNIIDNYDALLATLEGIRGAGVTTEITHCNLSERRMHVRVKAPELMAQAPRLLENYRSPFRDSGHGGEAAQNPYAVYAGFDFSNSEVGFGAYTLTPVLIVQVCDNGMVITDDRLRKVHLGSQMEEGLIRWSDDTRRKTVELVKAQTVDAVRTFLDAEYLLAKIAQIEAEAACELPEPTKVIERVAKQLSFTEQEAEGILGHFIKGGDLTAGGVLHAVTSFSQVIPDPDRAIEVEEQGIEAMRFACSLA